MSNIFCLFVAPSEEVGFIHPMQFAAFNEEVHSSPSSSSGVGSQLEDKISKSKPVRDSCSDSYFWHSEHKLGISTHVLVPLYRAAKDAFMDSYKRYRMLSDSQIKKDDTLDKNASMCLASFLDIVESEVMKHSRALLLLSCDFGTAWNSRYLLFYFIFLFFLFDIEIPVFI